MEGHVWTIVSITRLLGLLSRKVISVNASLRFGRDSIPILSLAKGYTNLRPKDEIIRVIIIVVVVVVVVAVLLHISSSF